MKATGLVVTNSQKQSLTIAVIMMMLSVAAYATQDVLVKLLPPEITIVQISFFRALFAFIPIFILGWMEYRPGLMKTTQWPLHIWRSLFSSLALLGFIGSFRLIPLAEAYSLSYSCPLFMTALSIPLLNEKVSVWGWATIMTGFAGVIVIMRPDAGLLDVGGGFALVGGMSYAISLIFVRSLTHHHRDSNTLIVTSFTLICCLLLLPFLPFNWVPMDQHTFGMLTVIGILGGSAQYAMTQAFRMAPVSKIAPFDYVSILWAVGFGYFIFGEVPEIYVILGGLMIIGSGLVILRSEKLKVAYDQN